MTCFVVNISNLSQHLANINFRTLQYEIIVAKKRNYSCYVHMFCLVSYVHTYMYNIAHVHLKTQNYIRACFANVSENVMIYSETINGIFIRTHSGDERASI